ncbi:hypothetical protein ACS0TY_035797 [Phlomoides rotata]
MHLNYTVLVQEFTGARHSQQPTIISINSKNIPKKAAAFGIILVLGACYFVAIIVFQSFTPLHYLPPPPIVFLSHLEHQSTPLPFWQQPVSPAKFMKFRNASSL